MRRLRIAVTTGDKDGIGTEVAGKALAELGPTKQTQFVLWRSPHCSKADLRRIDRKFKRMTFSDPASALREAPWSPKILIDICSARPEPAWVVEATLACQSGLCDALVTGPLDKRTIRKSGMREVGHTEILARLTGSKGLFMTFLGHDFNVLLLTAHMPLAEVPKQLNRQAVSLGLRRADAIRRLLPKSQRRLPIAVVGLNPHAGESGLIGDFEQRVFAPAIRAANRAGLRVVGPLVPDAAYTRSSRRKYAILVCPYHDQGLIPFKMVHGYDAGTHLTAGLPFVRTSVDHGTAKDIFGKGLAKAGSMREALLWAIRLTIAQSAQYRSKRKS